MRIMSGCITVSCFELCYVKVHHMINGDVHHFVMHVPEVKLDNKHILFGALYPLFGELQNIFNVWPWVFIESLETPCTSDDFKSMVTALQMIGLPRTKVRTDLYKERNQGHSKPSKGVQIALKNCACKHCNAEHSGNNFNIYIFFFF